MSFNKARVKRSAEYYLTQGNIQSAIYEYRLLVQNDPKDFNTQNVLGDLYVKAESNDEAIACYKKVAEFYDKQGYAKKAIAIYNKIHRLEPESIDVSAKLAELYRLRGSYAEARNHYEKLAAHYESSGQHADALSSWELIAELDPRNAEIYLKIADSYWKDGRSSDAASAFIQAGSRLASEGSHASAVTAFSRALEISPLDSEAIEGFVRSQIELGYPEEAVKALQQKIADNPYDRDANILLLDCFYDMGDTSSAEAVIVKMVERDPSNYLRFVELIEVFLKNDELDSAVRSMSVIAEHMLVGEKHTELLALIEEVLARNPEHIGALRLLARYHGWLKDDSERKNALERVAESARINGSLEDEQYALSELAAIAPHDSNISSRIEQLSDGNSYDRSITTEGRNKEVPSFESYAVLSDDGDTAQNGFSASGENDSAGFDSDSDNSDFESSNGAKPGSYSNEDPLEAEIVSEAGDHDAGESSNLSEFGMDSKNGIEAEEMSAYGWSENLDQTNSTTDKAAPLSSSDEMRLEEALESIGFYIEQGYTGLADKSLLELESEFGARPELVELRRQLTVEPGAASQEAEEIDSANHLDSGDELASGVSEMSSENNSEREPETAEDDGAGIVPDEDAETTAVEVEEEPEVEAEGQAIESSSEQNGIADELDNPEETDNTLIDEDTDLSNSFENLRDELGLSESDKSEEEDNFENHYQPAVAYQEMGLLEEAIREFQDAVNTVKPDDGTQRFLNCCTLLGHCFLQKEMPKLAVVWFKRAFESSELSADELKGIHYELGNAHECNGDFENSVSSFEEIYAIDVDYRDVAARLQKLREHQTVAS